MLTVLPVVSEGPKTEHGIQGVAFTLSSTAVSPFPGPVSHASSQNAIGLGHLGTCWLIKKGWFPSDFISYTCLYAEVRLSGIQQVLSWKDETN